MVACTRCTRKLGEEDRVFSQFTRSYYCTDHARCDSRRRRLGLDAASQIAARLRELEVQR
jgi:hypothetical protein